MISKLQDLLLEEDLDRSDKLELRAALENVASGNASEDEQVAMWSRLKSVAPTLWGTAQGIVINVASAAVRKELGL